ncbi:hypothetical protein CPB86DRAFT_790995 [Serendipita vermifera]|nr:hypothetical protein CPB86DRAFT_790995 [Serendipita vermifera]
MAIFPNLIVEMSFAPLQIETGFATIRNQNLCSQQAAQKLALDMRRNLQLVCRSWKQIIDSIKLEKQCVTDFGYEDGDDSLPVDTDGCLRLNLKCMVYSRTSFIRLAWTHPVATVSLRIWSKNITTRARVTSLGDIISFPEHIRALALEFGKLMVEKQVFSDLQTISPPLTTLCITLQSDTPLETPLRIPTLVTLFISIEVCGFEAHPSDLRWIFPALRNLSLIEEDEEYRDIISMSSHTNPFFTALLEDHFSQIKSLLIYPTTRQIHYQDSPLCWVHMPNLRVLAAHFACIDIRYPGEPLPKSNSPILKSKSLRNLIQCHMDWVEEEKIVDGLQRYILACSQLEGVTFVGASDELLTKLKTGKGSKSVKKFIRLCEDRHIELWGQRWASISERTLIRSPRR